MANNKNNAKSTTAKANNETATTESCKEQENQTEATNCELLEQELLKKNNVLAELEQQKTELQQQRDQLTSKVAELEQKLAEQQQNGAKKKQFVVITRKNDLCRTDYVANGFEITTARFNRIKERMPKIRVGDFCNESIIFPMIGIKMEFDEFEKNLRKDPNVLSHADFIFVSE